MSFGATPPPLEKWKTSVGATRLKEVALPFLSTSCPNIELTSSTSLVDDPSASLSFKLTEARVVFVTYSVGKRHGISSDYRGTKFGIMVDDVDVALIESSPYSTAYANGAFLFWIGELGVGSHTIKGRFASITGGTTRISERRLLIATFDPSEVDYHYKRSSTPVTFVQQQPPDLQTEVDTLAESSHPYPPDYDNTWTIQRVGALCIRGHFSRVVIEDYYDHLYLRDADANLIKDYTGYDKEDFWTPWLTGDTLQLQLTSDSSVEYYGFCLDKIEYSYTGTPPEFSPDTEAKFEFDLSEVKKALILYSACNYYDQPEHAHGKKIAIEIDGTIGTGLGSSPYGENYPDSEFIAEIHSLGSGSHTIKGKFAPNDEEPATINDRQFGILLFSSALPTNFVESSVQVSQVGTDLTDDAEAGAQKTLTETRCVLAIYCAGKEHGTISSRRGKKIGINIEGTDYTLNAQSPYAEECANTVGIQSDVVKLSAGLRTIKGRFASNLSGETAKIDDRKLCVLWFAEAEIKKKRQLIIQKQCEGALTPSEGTYAYWTTQDISVLATPEDGWLLDHWELDGVDVGSANPYTVQTDDKHTLKAFFTAVGVSSVQAFETGGFLRSVGFSSQRRVFYKDGYYYLFHQDTNNDTVYKVSIDKENWTKPATGNPVATAADTGNDSRGVEVEYFGGSKVYVVVARNAPFSSSGYTHWKIKEGTISNGEIAWGDWVTIVYKSWSSSYYWSQFGSPSLCQATDGYFWMLIKVNWENSPVRSWCCRSTNPNDISSWTGLSDVLWSHTWWCQNISLLDGYCYQIDNYRGIDVRGRTLKMDPWEAGAWETITELDVWGTPCVLSTPDGAVHFLYIRGYGGVAQDLRYRKRTIDGVWGPEEILATGYGTLGSCSLSYIDGSLYAIYRNGSEIYYRKLVAGIWQDAVKVSCAESGYTTNLSTTRTLPELTGFMIMWAISAGKMIRVVCK